MDGRGGRVDVVVMIQLYFFVIANFIPPHGLQHNHSNPTDDTDILHQLLLTNSRIAAVSTTTIVVFTYLHKIVIIIVIINTITEQ